MRKSWNLRKWENSNNNEKRLGPELGVNLSLPFRTKILNALRSEWLSDLDLIRLKEGSCLSPATAPNNPWATSMLSHACRACRGHGFCLSAFPSSDFYFPFTPSPSFNRERRSVAAGLRLGSWGLSCGTWSDDRVFERRNMKGLLCIAGRPQPGDSYRRQSLWSQWDCKACKSVWNLAFSWKSEGYLFYLHMNYF